MKTISLRIVCVLMILIALSTSLFVAAKESGEEDIIKSIRQDYGIEENEDILKEFIAYYDIQMDDLLNSNIPFLFEEFMKDYKENIDGYSFIHEKVYSDKVDLNKLCKVQFISNENNDIYMIAIDFDLGCKYYGRASSLADIRNAERNEMSEDEISDTLDKFLSFEMDKWNGEYVSSDGEDSGWYSWKVLLLDTDGNQKTISGWGVSADNQPVHFGDFQKLMWEIAG